MTGPLTIDRSHLDHLLADVVHLCMLIMCACIDHVQISDLAFVGNEGEEACAHGCHVCMWITCRCLAWLWAVMMERRRVSMVVFSITCLPTWLTCALGSRVLVGHVQMFDLAVGGDDGEEARVEGMPAETYMERFSWDEAKYPPRRPLKDTVAAVTDIVAELEDSLKASAVPLRTQQSSTQHYSTVH